MATPRRLDLAFAVKSLACGAHHSVVLTEDGQLYGCGLATQGQLGLIEETLQGRVPPCNQLYPQMAHMPLQSASGIIQVACGDNFTIALSASGNIYSTGHGGYGIHGAGADELASRYQFAPVGHGGEGYFKARQIKYISAGENHCGAIDANGNAYTWGLNASGQCGVAGQR